MKRKMMLTALCALLACALSGCAFAGGRKPKDGYEALNEMLSSDYSKIVLTVTDTFADESVLTSVYEFTYPSSGNTAVRYTVEKFAPVGLDGADGQKITLTGVAIVQADGTLFAASGDDIGLPATFSTRGMTFEEENFDRPALTEGFFEADVKDAEAFLGTEFDCTGMRVTASFSDRFDYLKITCTAGGNTVSYRYDFTK